MTKILIVTFLILILIYGVKVAMAQQSQSDQKNTTVRRPYVAGQFYPGSAAELTRMVDEYLEKADPTTVGGEVKAIIVPHAGYIYSGEVAAYGFKVIPEKIKKVFILGANHNANAGYFKFSVASEDYYQTPLGQVKVSSISHDLLKNKLFVDEPNANLSHIIEVELPFLQKRLDDFEIIPIVLGTANAEDLTSLASSLSSYLDDQTLIVVSSDLSHYYPYDRAVAIDKETIGNIEIMDIEKAVRGEACGMPGVMVLMLIAQQQGWKARILDYRNSGDTAGDKSRVVGYSSIVFYKAPEKELTDGDKQFLLKLSRETLESFITSKKKPEVDKSKLSEALKNNQACFVTLTKRHQLRGCIGDLYAHRPLVDAVIGNTIAAAVEDPRFSPVTENELKDIKIEISALTAPKELKNEGPDKLLQFLVPLKHGLILSNHGRRATFLPQVWEQLPQKEEFLEHLCQKAGLPAACWKDPATQFQVYEAIMWEE